MSVRYTGVPQTETFTGQDVVADLRIFLKPHFTQGSPGYRGPEVLQRLTLTDQWIKLCPSMSASNLGETNEDLEWTTTKLKSARQR